MTSSKSSRVSPPSFLKTREDLREDLGEQIEKLKGWSRKPGIPIKVKVSIANSMGHLAGRSNELIRDTDMERLGTRLEALEKALGIVSTEVVIGP